jgi:23S rRNA-/tRNA-specific pseudouridylate synthase
LGFQREPSPAHRLDTDTSGCLLLARNPKALVRFARAFEERVVEKRYLGILAGEIGEHEGTIALSLSKISSAENGWRMIAAKKGKPAVTHWRRLAVAGGRFAASLLFQVRPHDPASLAGAVGLLAVIAAFASYVPARRATRIDPVTALRTD